MSITLSPPPSLKGEGVQHYPNSLPLQPISVNSLPLQGEGKGGGAVTKGGVTRNAPEKIIIHAKHLRRNLTEVEKKLWYHLRAKRFSEYKFRRQHPIECYVVDFICLKAKLIIELDGGQHSKESDYDNKRTRFLEAKGFHMLRFWNNDVLENREAVLERILETLSPSLSLKGEGVQHYPNSLCLKGEGKKVHIP